MSSRIVLYNGVGEDGIRFMTKHHKKSRPSRIIAASEIHSNHGHGWNKKNPPPRCSPRARRCRL